MNFVMTSGVGMKMTEQCTSQECIRYSQGSMVEQDDEQVLDSLKVTLFARGRAVKKIQGILGCFCG
tara:strand:- start:2045 stop:2242 length:198 start_codon:yes stop_codon:yes gene_type:complete